MTDVKPSRELCSDQAYLRRRFERLALVDAPPGIVSQAKQACAP